jgi:hypothetical protein
MGIEAQGSFLSALYNRLEELYNQRPASFNTIDPRLNPKPSLLAEPRPLNFSMNQSHKSHSLLIRSLMQDTEETVHGNWWATRRTDLAGLLFLECLVNCCGCCKA